METFDLIVIGAGRSGLEAATLAARRGVRVALVERDRPGGRHALGERAVAEIAAAGRAIASARRVAAFGLDRHDPTFKFTRLADALLGRIAAGPAPLDVAAIEALGIHYGRGEARFTAPLTLAVGEQILTAKRVVIATGSRATLPALAGLAADSVTDALGLARGHQLPRSVAVLGASLETVPLAQALQRLGSRVTLAVGAGEMLPLFSLTLQEALSRQIAADGVDLRPARATAVCREGGERVVTLAGPNREPQDVRVSAVVAALVTLPDLEALALPVAGVEASASGITVDGRQRTSAAAVWCVGSAASDPCPEWMGRHQARLAVDAALGGGRARPRPDLAPLVVATDPEAARVGITEAEVRRRGEECLVATAPLGGPQGDGLVRLVAEPDGRLLGGEALGPDAALLAAVIELALRMELGVEEVAALPLPSSAAAQALAAAAEELCRRQRGSTWSRITARLRRG